MYMKAIRPLPHRLAAAALLAATVLTAQATPSAFVTQDDPRSTPARVTSFNQGGFQQIFVDGYIHKPTVEAVLKTIASEPAQYGMVCSTRRGETL